MPLSRVHRIFWRINQNLPKPTRIPLARISDLRTRLTQVRYEHSALQAEHESPSSLFKIVVSRLQLGNPFFPKTTRQLQELAGAQPQWPLPQHFYYYYYYYSRHFTFPQHHSVPHRLARNGLTKHFVRPNNPHSQKPTPSQSSGQRLPRNALLSQSSNTQPRASSNQCIIVRGLPEIRINRAAQ